MFSKTETFQSETFPGVEYTLYKVGIQLRHRMQIAASEATLRQRVLDGEITSFVKDKQPIQELSKTDQVRYYGLDNERTLAVIEERMIWFKHVVQSIQLADGESVKPEDFLMYGDTDLYKEINTKILVSLGLEGDLEKNSSRPTTSPEPVDGPTPTTSADTASSGNSTESEIATNTSPS